MSRILILRPEPGASESLRGARDRHLDAVAMPLFQVIALPWRPPDPAQFDGLLFTSANAIRHAGDGLQELRGLQVYAVGGATAEAARQAGFEIAVTGEGGIERLLEPIQPDLRLLHLCGADRHDPAAPRQSITALPVYESRMTENVDLGPVDGAIALIHSPRAGRRFAELIGNRGGSVTLVAISQAAADAAGTGWQRVAVVDRPNDEALLALAASLCNKSPPQ